MVVPVGTAFGLCGWTVMTVWGSPSLPQSISVTLPSSSRNLCSCSLAKFRLRPPNSFLDLLPSSTTVAASLWVDVVGPVVVATVGLGASEPPVAMAVPARPR